MGDTGIPERGLPSPRDVRRLAAGAVAVLALLAVPLAGGAALAGGWPAAVSAVVGVGFVALLFGGSALLLAGVARHGDGTAVAVMVGGALARMALYAASLAGLAQLAWVHRPSLAAATGASVAVALGYELRLLSRMPRLFWIDAARRPALPNATRSEPL